MKTFFSHTVNSCQKPKGHIDLSGLKTNSRVRETIFRRLLGWLHYLHHLLSGRGERKPFLEKQPDKHQARWTSGGRVLRGDSAVGYSFSCSLFLCRMSSLSGPPEMEPALLFPSAARLQCWSRGEQTSSLCFLHSGMILLQGLRITLVWRDLWRYLVCSSLLEAGAALNFVQVAQYHVS